MLDLTVNPGAVVAVFAAPADRERLREVLRSVDGRITLHDLAVKEIESFQNRGEKVDVALLCALGEGNSLDGMLPGMQNILKSSGQLIVQAEVSEGNAPQDNLYTENGLIMEIIKAGFVKDKTIELDAESMKTLKISANGGAKLVEMYCKKVDSEATTSVAIPLKKKAPVEAQANGSNGTNAASTWKLMVNDLDEERSAANREAENDEDDVLDEDELLELDELPAAPAAPACGTEKKRRACKNCSCGLKEMEENGEMPKRDPMEAVSSCGNCFRGDAFRCASCPFLGKPAFKPGQEKLVLDLDD